MAKREDLSDWLMNALKANGGSATIIDVCKYVWDSFGEELGSSGDLFYTWQYDIRWAATQLRKQGVMRAANISPKGIWELK